MLLKKHERLIAAVNAVYISVFACIAWRHANYEFVMYVAIIVLLFALIVAVQRRVRFPAMILCGLTLWGLFHMAGGNLRLGDDAVLYEWCIVPGALRFDQLVHFFGFGVATLVCHHLLQPHLRHDRSPGLVLACLVVLMGCGVGAANEIIEFAAVLVMPETGVGGYRNTLMDMVYNLLGAMAAVAYLAATHRLSGHAADAG